MTFHTLVSFFVMALDEVLTFSFFDIKDDDSFVWRLNVGDKYRNHVPPPLVCRSRVRKLEDGSEELLLISNDRKALKIVTKDNIPIKFYVKDAFFLNRRFYSHFTHTSISLTRVDDDDGEMTEFRVFRNYPYMKKYILKKLSKV